MLKALLALVSALNLVASPAFGKNKVASAMEETYSLYHASRTLPEFMSRVQSKMPRAWHEFLMSKTQGATELPKLQKMNGSSFVFKFGSSMTLVKVISEADLIFEINHKRVQFDREAPIEENWKKINAALPRATSLIDLLVPRAHALVPALIVGGVITAYFGTMANLAGCHEIVSAGTKCARGQEQLGHLSWMEYQLKKAPTAEDIAKIRDDLAKVEAARQAGYVKHLYCEDDKKRLDSCIDLFVQTAKSVLKTDIRAGAAPSPGGAAGSSSGAPR